MKTTDAFTGLECIDCGAAVDASESHRCPDCGGARSESTYDYDAIDLDRETLADRPFDSQWRYAELLPFARESAVTTAEGATPLVDCPDLADELGVGRVLIKDDGRNPTGSSTDRGASVAVTAAVHHGASDVALPSTGNGGQAVAAYAGRAGLDSHAYLPSRSGFTNKAMVNVHGGDMNVVGGRFGDAAGAFEEALDEHDDWYSLRSFDTPYRHEGREDAVLRDCRTTRVGRSRRDLLSHGSRRRDRRTRHGRTRVSGTGSDRRSARSLRRPGVRLCADRRGVRRRPRRARAGRTPRHDLWRTRDSRSRGESANPRGAPARAAAAAVATEDPDILEAAVRVAQTTTGSNSSRARRRPRAARGELAERDAFDGDETVVIVNTGSGNKEADVLRSHLMSQGVSRSIRARATIWSALSCSNRECGLALRPGTLGGLRAEPRHRLSNHPRPCSNE